MLKPDIEEKMVIIQEETWQTDFAEQQFSATCCNTGEILRGSLILCAAFTTYCPLQLSLVSNNGTWLAELYFHSYEDAKNK